MLPKISRFVLAAALLLSGTPAFAQPVRVMPVTTEGSLIGSGPYAFVLVNGVLYFDLNGVLWKSDGTTAGTVMVKKVYPDFATVGSAAVGNRLFFNGGTLAGRGLWVTDGTLAGTQLLKTGHPKNITDVNGTVFFTQGGLLFKSDGTPAGTVLVKDHGGAEPGGLVNLGGALMYGAGGSLWRLDPATGSATVVRTFTSGPNGLGVVHGGKLYFSADGGAPGGGVWVSDGTPAGTNLISSGLTNPAHFAPIGPHVYFSANDAAAGREIWRTDGTPAGTVRVADVNPGTADSSPVDFTALGSMVIFAAAGVEGREVWRTDGTAAGTVMVKDILPGSFFGGAHSSEPARFTAANGALCFTTSLGRNLWRTDGTEAGTIELIRNDGSYFSAPGIVSTGARVYFVKRTSSAIQLWASDCNTPGGNVLVKEFNFGIYGDPGSTHSVTAMGDHLLLRASTAAQGNELWRVDGAGASLVKDVEPGVGNGLEAIWPDWGNLEPRPPQVRSWLRAGNAFYFRGVTKAGGGELWRSDGTAAGTALVKDIAPGAPADYPDNPYNSYPDELTAVGGTVFFVADDRIHGRELWKTDGTEAGTVLVKEIIPEPWYGPVGLTNVNGTLYFNAHDDLNGYELWKSDGTTAGTVMVKDIVPGAGSSGAYPIGDLGGTLMFCANSPEVGSLWKSDGTAAGTVLVKQASSGTSGVCGGPAVVMNGVLYYVMSRGPNGAELWRSDGTAAGTSTVFTTTALSSLNRPTVVGNTLYFWTDNYQAGAALWKSDGTPGGTVQLRVFAGAYAFLEYDKYDFVALNGILYFPVASPTDDGLWRTDGTPEGTYRIDLFPGFSASSPNELTVMGDRLYFLANDGVNPRSLYYYVPRPPGQEITRLGNLASRTQVLSGDNVMIGGFVVGGALPKCVAIQATGPSLSQFGVTGPLQDPRLTLVRASDQAVIAENDDWQTAPASPCLQAGAFVVTDPREARIVAELPPGAYTAIVRGANDSDTGVAVLGIYEIDRPSVPLVNISARGPVFGGEQQMIGGFVIQGPNPQTVAVVATGPSLAAHGIGNPLQDPVLTIVRQSDHSVVATNDNWMDAANAVDLDGAGFAPSHSKEAGLLVTLPPGAYTAVVSGTGGGTGVAVVGVYRVN